MSEEKKRKRSSEQRAKLISRIQILAMILVAIAICAVLFVLYQDLPAIRAARSMRRAEKYQESGNYESAALNYADAVAYNVHNVTTYESLAQCYLELGDEESAKNVLYDGYKNTGDEDLFANYITLCLNESVNKINSGEADLDMVQEVLKILVQVPDNEQAREILYSAWQDALFYDGGEEDGINRIFSFGAEGDAAYEQYTQILQSMLDLYETAPSDTLSDIIMQYLTPSGNTVYLQLQYAQEYAALLEDAKQTLAGDMALSDSFLECLSDASAEITAFEDLFDQLDAGNLEAIRGFLVSETYIQIRNSFFNETNGVWTSASGIPVSREGIVLTKGIDGWEYHFMSFAENEDAQGVLTIWTQVVADSEAENLQISYEPALEDGSYYPHTLYTITCQYNGEQLEGETEASYMLYTTVYLENGTTTESITMDWGGLGEYTIELDGALEDSQE